MTLSANMLMKLEAADMWFVRNMSWISHTEHITSEEVLHRANTNRKLLSEIVNIQVLPGHVMQSDEVEKLMMAGFLEGKRAR